MKQIADEKYYLAARVAKLEEMYKQHSIVELFYLFNHSC